MATIQDGRSATLAVRKYFEETYGPLAVLGFEVDEVRYLKAEKKWVVKCRFYQSLMATQKVAYQVIVNEDGTIADVEKLTK